MNIVTLADGRQVPSDSEEWKAECLRKWEAHHPDSTHHAHLMNLRSIPGSADRRAYIEAVGRAEGTYAAEKLQAAYAIIWEGRKGARNAR